jgi:hypothetical protein
MLYALLVGLTFVCTIISFHRDLQRQHALLQELLVRTSCLNSLSGFKSARGPGSDHSTSARSAQFAGRKLVSAALRDSSVRPAATETSGEYW